MGRAARAKRKGQIRVKLTEAEFHKLRSQLRLLELTKLEAREKAAQIAQQFVQKEIAETAAQGNKLWESLAAKYSFDPKLLYDFDDATCELVAEKAAVSRG